MAGMARVRMATDNDKRPSGESILDGERPANPTLGKLWDLAHRSSDAPATKPGPVKPLRKPSDEVVIVGAESDDAADHQPLTVQRALPLEARLRSAARELNKVGGDGVFTEFPIKVGNEFPTSLTRLPIFRPSKRVSQQQIQDTDNAVPFETPYFKGRRHGPPLTIRDEDTLIALMRMRDRALRGPEHALPVNIRDIFQAEGKTTEVHRVVCTIDQINCELGLTDSGKNFKVTVACLKRLNASKIELEKRAADNGRLGGSFDLVKIQWLVYEQHGLIDAVFPPLMANWLRHSYTYIDWQIRQSLKSDLAKALHRFLSGQRLVFEMNLEKIAITIGYDGRKEHRRRNFNAACDELVSVGFLSGFELLGNGRSTPLKLRVCRPQATD